MVMGHIGYGAMFDHFIHAFHMPMFFWVSGYLYRRRAASEMSVFKFLGKKAKSLLIPYAVFGGLYYLLHVLKDILTHNSIDPAPLIHLFSVNTEGLPIAGALWFLTALFFADLLFFLIDRYIKNGKLKALVVLLLATVGTSASVIFPFTLPFALGPGLVGVGWYYIGYLFRKYESKKLLAFLMNMKWIPTILLGIITTVLIFLNGYINMRVGNYSVIPPLFWINAVLAIVVGVNLSKLIYGCIQNRLPGKWLIDIGKNSIVYLCCNEIVIALVGTVCNRLPLPAFLPGILILLITMPVLYLISKIFTKTKLKLLIGKS